MKAILVILSFLPTTIAVRDCYACSDHYPGNVGSCIGGSRTKTVCETATESCVSVTGSDNKTDKGCLTDQDGNPMTLPGGEGYELF
jgi:hypothetical protein